MSKGNPKKQVRIQAKAEKDQDSKLRELQKQLST